MTYVASPTFSPDPAVRRVNLEQCLEVARRHLDETSNASEAEKDAVLTASAVAAGWTEEEVAGLLQEKASSVVERLDRQPRPIGLVPSSSL